MKKTKNQQRLARKRRIRSKVHGTAARPRLSVHVSVTRIAVQVIDDDAGRTLAAATTTEAKAKGKNIESAKKLGELIAKKAKDAKVTAVVFDRNGRRYHGRIKALADSARAAGLTF